MKKFSRYHIMNPRTVLLEWTDTIPHDDIVAFYNAISSEGIEDKVISYNSILIRYVKEQNMNERVEELYDIKVDTHRMKTSAWEIPVCYDIEFGIDLQRLSMELGLTSDEIIEIHSSKTYNLFATGFLPGFPYLGYTDEKIYCHRHKVPRKAVPKGSVGIAGNQTGIYPQDSPGGWQIIGRTPITLFDTRQDYVFSVGDIISFSPITRQVFYDILEGRHSFQLTDTYD